MSAGSSSPRGSADPSLERAQAREHELRTRLAELIRERRRMWRESNQLQARAHLSGADPRLEEIVARYRTRADELGREVEKVRAQLRVQEAVVAESRADADGV